jgi:hypothetical protein
MEKPKDNAEQNREEFATPWLLRDRESKALTTRDNHGFSQRLKYRVWRFDVTVNSPTWQDNIVEEVHSVIPISWSVISRCHLGVGAIV